MELRLTFRDESSAQGHNHVRQNIKDPRQDLRTEAPSHRSTGLG